eukprot:11670448-Alexandrium_andersonii.AAC.1
MRARRYYSVAELIQLCKAQILSLIEYRTAAVAYAADSTLAPLGALQTRFLRDIEVSPREALCRHGLAPLAVHRDIAFLGITQRTALGKGPLHFRRFFHIAENPSPARICRRAKH